MVVLVLNNINFSAGISLVDEAQVYTEDKSSTEVSAGLLRAYSVPQAEIQETEQCTEATDVSLEELMKQMKSI